MKKIIKKIWLFPRNALIFVIRIYQKHISPHMGRVQAVDKYGIIKGSLLGIIRILKCNPFSKGGVDLLK